MILKYIVFTVFLKTLLISCDKQYGSLTFVIDTTGSMRQEIQLVREAANNIMDIILYNNSTQIKDAVVVTFNDPDLPDMARHDLSTKVILKESRNVTEVKDTLANLEVYAGGDDCVEYSLSGIKMGLSESRRNSYLFVFTDAPPKEVYNYRVFKSGKKATTLNKTKFAKELADINKLAQSRGSPVFFFLSPGYCSNKESFMAYQDISSATNGQVFTLQQKHDVKLLIPFLTAVISGSVNTINRVVIKADQWGTVPFTVDDYTEYVIISASSSGNKVEMLFSKKPTNNLNTHYIARTNNNKVLQINSPPPGDYEMQVRGSKETTVMVFGRTDFNFQHGFSETVPPTFRNDKPQPTDGVKSSLLVNVNDPTQSVDIKTAQIVSPDGSTVYYSLPLKKQSKNYYSTDSILPPKSMFLITVIGEGKITHKEIHRTAKTPIQARPRDTDPEISIDGRGTYLYRSVVLLTCRVKAFPPPSIIWKDDKGNILRNNMSIQKIDTYNYISKMYINNLTHKGAYYCQAQVGYNENSERVDLDVTSPFIVNEDSSKAPITVEFENSVELKCNIKSDFPMEIVWYHVSGKQNLTNSATHHISSDGTLMIVKKVRQEDEGKYICEAKMQNDKDTTYQIEKEIKIKHLAPLIGQSGKIDIKENASVNIKCNIMKAYPKPKVEWMFREIKSNLFRPLYKEGDYLKINVASIDSAGVYKCVASNDMGSSSHETMVTVLITPKISLFVNNEKKSIVIVEYNSNLQFICRVISHSSPDIAWENEKGEIFKADRKISGYNEYTSYLTIQQIRRSGIYYCKAKNELATDRIGVQVQVKSPFQVSAKNRYYQARYGDDLTIHCGVKSHLPINITWTREKGDKITSSDKYSVFKDGKVLQIKNAKRDSIGKYICTAFIADDESIHQSHETIVDVIAEKPSIDKQIDVTVYRDETAVLKCRITKGLPKPTIIWMVMKGKMSNFTVLPETRESLTVPYAQYHDTGSYKCRAKNDVGIDEQTVKLVVEGPPIISSDEDKLYTALEGDVSLRIPCVTDGYPKPVVKWTIGSRTESDRKFKIDTDDTLVIYNPRKEDSGNYKCEATNKFGTVERMFEALVMVTPKISLFVNNEKKSIVIVEYNSNLQFICRVISHSSPDIAWENEKGEIFKADRKISGYNEYTSYLTIQQIRRSGIYYCKAKNELATERIGVQVQVKSPFQVSAKNRYYQARYGDDLTIHCGVKSHLPINITWTREKGDKITSSDKYSVLKDGKVLQIKNAKRDSIGKYICTAFIADDESIHQSHETIVDVIAEKPSIDKQKDVTVYRDETAVLKCRITKGLPKPTIIWMVMKGKMSNFTVLPETRESLTVPYAQYHDTGSYKCRAKNDVGIDEQTVKLVVEGPPIISSDEDKLYTALEGDVSLRIPCVTDGYPKPVIKWTTGSRTESDRKFKIDTDDTLVIYNPRKEDSGNYKCEATNKFGTVERMFEALVMEYVDLDQDGDTVGNITYVDILEGTTEHRSCASGSLKGRWYKEGLPMNVTGVLTIEDASLSDEGNYTCRVSEMTGSESHTYIVVVGKQPEFEDPDDENLENWKGDARSLYCAVFMRPNERTAKAEWTYNGKPSYLATGEFAQSEHPIVSWGQYTCTIGNVHGNVTKHFNVHSTGCLMHLNSTVSRSPLVLNPVGSWSKMTIKQQYIYIPHNQEVLLTCHNQSEPNFFEKIPQKSELLATCDHQDNFVVKDSTYKVFDLKCITEVEPVIKATGEKCFYENTEIIKVGYNVQTPHPHFLEVYSICFDNRKKVAIYSKLYSTHTNQDHQENALWKNLGYYNETNEKLCVDDSECCLSQQPLVDEKDVARGPAQWATFIKGLNTVPYWRGCNNETWDAVDSAIRYQIIKPYDLVSGAFNYTNYNGTMVPRYLWKVVRTSTSSLVYVKVNDPHPTAEDILCQGTSCPSWMPKHQYSYCCRLSEFQNILPGVID